MSGDPSQRLALLLTLLPALPSFPGARQLSVFLFPSFHPAELTGFAVSGPTSFLFPGFRVFLSLPGALRILHLFAPPSTFTAAVGILIVTSSRCSSSDPGTLATTILATLYLSFPFLSVLFRQLRCHSLQVHCRTHPSQLLRQASRSVLYPRYPRFFLARQSVVALFISQHAASTHPALIHLSNAAFF